MSAVLILLATCVFAAEANYSAPSLFDRPCCFAELLKTKAEELRDLAPGLDLRELNTERPLFEDPDFPASDASIGGLLGDKANPNVAQYLEDEGVF